jgi:hypothetical protein
VGGPGYPVVKSGQLQNQINLVLLITRDKTPRHRGGGGGGVCVCDYILGYGVGVNCI